MFLSSLFCGQLFYLLNPLSIKNFNGLPLLERSYFLLSFSFMLILSRKTRTSQEVRCNTFSEFCTMVVNKLKYYINAKLLPWKCTLKNY